MMASIRTGIIHSLHGRGRSVSTSAVKNLPPCVPYTFKLFKPFKLFNPFAAPFWSLDTVGCRRQRITLLWCLRSSTSLTPSTPLTCSSPIRNQGGRAPGFPDPLAASGRRGRLDRRRYASCMVVLTTPSDRSRVAARAWLAPLDRETSSSRHPLGWTLQQRRRR